jgi:hypothetical protein
MKHVSTLFSELKFHGKLTAQTLAKYDCELESENSNYLAYFSDFQTDNNPGFSEATGHFTQVSPRF